MRIARCLWFAFATIASLSGVSAAEVPWAGPWEVRYGQQPDQKPEWTAKGYTPAWTLQWQNRDKPVVSWKDNPKGDCRGWILLGRPFRIPSPAPASVMIEMEYQSACAMNEPQPRSGVLHAVLMPRSAWEKLARTPGAAQILDFSKLDPACVSASVHANRNDVLQWRKSGPVELTIPRTAQPNDEWIAGVAWGAYHYHCEEHGAIQEVKLTMVTPQEKAMAFWNALNLDFPGLENVRDAVKTGKANDAEKAFAAYLRQNNRPKVANPVQPAQSDRARTKTEEALQHTYYLAGCPQYTFKDKIVWNLDPFNYDQWAIALNRHFEWPVLAAGYLASHDEKFAKEWAAQVENWVASMPVLIGKRYIEGPYNQAGRAALSLDAGIRMGQTWFPSFEVFRTSPSVPDSALIAFVHSAWEHALYLMKEENFKSGSNWGAMESNGLYHIGALLPEFRDAAIWRDTAMQRTYAEMENQVYPDGAQTELAPGYHGVSLKNFLGVMKLARTNNLEIPADFANRMECMFDYYVRILLPNRRAPQFNDSGAFNPAGYFADAVELFPQRADFLWMKSDGKEGQQPPYTSTVMPWAGWVVMRSGWGPDDRALVFDAGPFGTGHQHEDKLGIILVAFGRDLVTEGGVYAYDESDWRRYVLSTRAHNTVRVDGKDQNCRAEKSEYRAEKPNEYGFRDDPRFTYARDIHTSGYGNPPDKSVVHRRRILFVKPDWWLVIDDLAANGNTPHTAESQFLINASGAALDPTTLRTLSAPAEPKQGRIAIIPLGSTGLKARIAQGEKQPEVRGFLPRGFEKLEPAPAVLYEHTFTGKALMAYALVPFSGDTCPLGDTKISNQGDKLTVELSFATGKTTRLQITPNRLTIESPDGTFEADEETLRP